MHTLQISATVLDGYKKERLSEERLGFLLAQVEEQLKEISQNKEVYASFLKAVSAPTNIDNVVLWMLIMSNEEIVEEYIEVFDKGFREIIPVGDLADLLLYCAHKKKVENIDLAGFDYFIKYEQEGIEEMDQYAFTNALLYIQKLKEVQIEF